MRMAILLIKFGEERRKKGMIAKIARCFDTQENACAGTSASLETETDIVVFLVMFEQGAETPYMDSTCYLISVQVGEIGIRTKHNHDEECVI